MTVNERLVHCGLMDEFDAAARAGDQPAMVAVLVKAGFTREQAESTSTQVITAPHRYGY